MMQALGLDDLCDLELAINRPDHSDGYQLGSLCTQYLGCEMLESVVVGGAHIMVCQGPNHIAIAHLI